MRRRIEAKERFQLGAACAGRHHLVRSVRERDEPDRHVRLNERIRLPLVEDTEEPSTVSSEEQPKVKEPAAKPLKPILPPITGGTPAPA